MLAPPAACRFAFLGLLLLFLTGNARALAPDAEFVLDTTYGHGGEPRPRAYTYLDDLKTPHLMPLRFGAPALAPSTDSLTVVTRARRHRFLFGNQSLALGLGAPTYGRWRYAHVTNTTLRLTNDAAALASSLATVAAHGHGTHLRCSAHAAAFCDAGAATVSALASVGVAADYRVLVDLDTPMGQLPPTLYFLLTNGRARLSLHGAGGVALPDVECIELAPLGLTLCDRDAAHFAMGSDNATVVIGGSFFRSTYALTLIDGWTGDLWALAALAEQPPYVVQVLGAVAALLSLLFTYGRWSTGENTPSIGLHLLRQVRLSNKTVDVLRTMTWLADWRIVLGTGLLVCSYVSGIVLSWLGTAPLLRAGTLLPPALTGDPDLLLLQGALTAYATLEFALALAFFFASDVSDDLCRSRRWYRTHPISVQLAWARHMAFSGAALSSALLNFMPLAYAGLGQDVRLTLALVLATGGVLVFFQIYYGFSAVAIAVAGLRPRHHTPYAAVAALPRRRNALLLAFAVVQVVLVAALDVLLALALAMPLVDGGSSLLARPYNQAAAVYLAVAPALLGVLFAAYETNATADHIYHMLLGK